MRRAILPSLARACLACACACGGADRAHLPLPDDPSVRTWVAATSSRGPPESPWSLAIGEGSEPLDLIVPSETAEVFLLGYRESRAALGAIGSSGSSGSTGDQSCRACALTHPQRVESLTLPHDTWSAAAIPETLADQLVPDRATRCAAVCPTLLMRDIVIPTGLSMAQCQLLLAPCRPIFAAPLDGRTVAVGMASGAILRVGTDGRSSPLCSITGSPIAGWPGAGRDLWIATAEGALRRLDRSALDEPGDCPIEQVIAPPEGAIPEVVAAAPASSTEIFALTSSRALVRYDGTRWEALYRFEINPRQVPGTLVWSEPNRVVATRGTGEVVEWKNGVLTTSRPLGGVDANVNAVGVAREGTLRVAVDGFGVYEAASIAGPWLPVPGFHSIPDPVSFATFGDHLVLTVDNGAELYHETAGYCANAVYPIGTYGAHLIAVLGQRALLVADTRVYSDAGLGVWISS
ncbi:MAG: hypothetical protein IT384_17370 [Deltaproteobacteria bacterium]|nr:hypothetical protein [Deltaproteobacteria bacterium]